MKLNFEEKIVNYDGKPFMDEKGHPLTIGSAIIAAANTHLEGDAHMPIAEKYAIGELGSLVSREVELNVEQIALAKKRTGAALGPCSLIYALHQAIEGKTESAEA